ncbi:2-keto-4-pentenoate hydratase [Lacimicrobium alkaliphilum]|uniref:2-keto-4-pentenoate hydratase n=1 Tax=Lacimicrobium alkaliphilum TaxID=1526571 RepID=A0ABQ1RA68_9ALTE|nr:fumarylacetoacetate hydrolase family protein [Lacimicrobium alkaliphilum]GGD61376.1 2-keto-4-pentenoate hydratase [Lacimicrobium alkaliphilum]
MTTSRSDAEQQAAEQLRQAAESGAPCKPVRTMLAEQDLESAYRVQNLNTRHWQQQGRRLVGRKIGLTSAVVQTQLGVDQPDFGALFADMAIAEGEEISSSLLLQPKIEAEVALVLERDLAMEQPTIADVIRATAFALPALEIVDSRIADWDINILDTIADNASSGLYVLGSQPVSLSQLDLKTCSMTLWKRGEPVSTGAGVACLGNPLSAALWLARTMSRFGQPLREGDTILTGALGPMVPAQPGDVFDCNISGLGNVSAYFAENPVAGESS